MTGRSIRMARGRRIVLVGMAIASLLVSEVASAGIIKQAPYTSADTARREIRDETGFGTTWTQANAVASNGSMYAEAHATSTLLVGVVCCPINDYGNVARGLGGTQATARAEIRQVIDGISAGSHTATVNISSISGSVETSPRLFDPGTQSFVLGGMGYLHSWVEFVFYPCPSDDSCNFTYFNQRLTQLIVYSGTYVGNLSVSRTFSAAVPGRLEIKVWMLVRTESTGSNGYARSKVNATLNSIEVT